MNADRKKAPRRLRRGNSKNEPPAAPAHIPATAQKFRKSLPKKIKSALICVHLRLKKATAQPPLSSFPLSSSPHPFSGFRFQVSGFLLLSLAIPVHSAQWTLPNGQTISGKQVESTSRVIVVEAENGTRHVIPRKQKKSISTTLNPQSAQLLQTYHSRQKRLLQLHTAGQLSTEHLKREQTALKSALLTRLSATHPDLTTQQLHHLIAHQ